MKFTLAWLRDYLKTDSSIDEILKALTDLGLEVEEVIDPVRKINHLKIGEIITAEKHPDADKLLVCNVLTDKGTQKIICGAPNARKGIKVVVAQPGDYVPGIDTTIKVGKIRGVESFGMMCSERELEISEEHDGIIELEPDAKVGQKYVDFVNNLDVTVDIAITPNRPDALGVNGIARDLAARGLGEFLEKKITAISGKYISPIKVNLHDEVINGPCPLFVGRYIRGVANKPSPNWLQNRLRSIGLRPISALVDITNFFTYDCARPLHVFDADKIGQELSVRKARDGEELIALDGENYSLTPDDTVIVSGDKVESLAGIIGGLDSGCNETTTNVFLESAFFSPQSTAKTGRRLKINSDARYRFERGIDSSFTIKGIELATEMILELCGGEPSNVVVAGKDPIVKRIISLDPTRVNSLVGMEIDEKEQIRILQELGFSTRRKEKIFHVKPPSWRPDISGEADLVEEIVRVNSLTKLKGIPLSRKNLGVGAPILTDKQKRIYTIRRKIASEGMNECITYSFIDSRSAEMFKNSVELIPLSNPISSEMSYMRSSLLPGLCFAAKRNQARSLNNLKLFEVGDSFVGSEPGQQSVHASGLMTGYFAQKNAFEKQRVVDVFDCKSVVSESLKEIGVYHENLLLKSDNAPQYFHPGRSGSFSQGPKNKLAFFGELHPEVVNFYGLKGPVMGFEIFIENIPFPNSKKLTRKPVINSEFQSVERDFAFVVDNSCPVEAIKKAILKVEKTFLAEVLVFDIFEGPKAELQLGHNKKSVAFAVKLQPLESTFTIEDIEKISQEIISSVKNAVGATLRA